MQILQAWTYSSLLFKTFAGWGIDGAMADYIKLLETLLHKLPDNVSFIEGAVIEPASTVTHAVIEKGNIKPEDFVVVIGPGPIGLIAAQVARASRAKKVVSVGIKDDVEYRLKVAKELNIDFIINVEEIDLNEFVLLHTDNYGADFVAERSGSEAGINLAIDILAKNGKFICMGMSGKEYIKFNWDKAIHKELDIIPLMSSTYNAWKYTIGMLEDGKINLEEIVSHIFPMSK